MLGELAADGARLLGPQVERLVLLLGVEKAELLALRLVDDGQDARDALAEVVASGKSVFAHILVQVRVCMWRKMFRSTHRPL